MDDFKLPLLIFFGMAVFVFILIRLGLKLQKKQTQKVEEEMKSFLNCTKDQLLEKKGVPTSVFKIDEEKELWSYIKIKQTQNAYIQTKDGRFMNDHLPVQREVKREFFIDKNGIIYNYRWENF